MVNIIVAVSQNGVIGSGNDLVFKISEDLKRFKELTSGSTVVMGRRTYESIGRPLPNRENIVITRNKGLKIEGVKVVSTIEESIEESSNKDIFVIGGGEIYKQFLSKNLVDFIYLTYICKDVEGDTFFEYPKNEFTEVSSETKKHNSLIYKFIDLKRNEKNSNGR